MQSDVTRRIVAIDPGKSGGIASIDGYDVVDALPMPVTERDQYVLLSRFVFEEYILPIFVVENVGGFIVQNKKTQTFHSKKACQFAMHCGMLRGFVIALDAPLHLVSPVKWMRGFLGSEYSTKHTKTQRKNAIKGKVQRLYPHIKVTLKTADALGMLTYARAQLHNGGL